LINLMYHQMYDIKKLLLLINSDKKHIALFKKINLIKIYISSEYIVLVAFCHKTPAIANQL
jgi:hypothetical protein